MLTHRALFIRWSAADKKDFNIHGLSPAMMQAIIEFAYTDSLSVTVDNVQELLLAADQFNVMKIVQACCDFLGERLCPENCIGIWKFTSILPCFELQSKAFQFILDHFEQVMSTEEFQYLSVQELTDILGRDDLNVKKENTVCEAIFHWITNRPEERTEHLLELLSKVSSATSFHLNLADRTISILYDRLGAFKPVAPRQRAEVILDYRLYTKRAELVGWKSEATAV